ncbi:hypothetical protein BBJ28_00014703 [Nothophytophthora sp. Chile5]|nr:hypothetical protein BBJ28_00014703 [Nothophytophthora sp. Chile5]
MAFGHKKEGLYLRPRVKRTTPLMDIALAVILGGVTGVYIFQDSMQRWQASEGEFAAAAAGKKDPNATTNSSASKQKKLTGMQREVLELLESNHRASHALYQGFGKTTLKQKWQDQKKSPAVKWLRKPFRNPARADLAGESGGSEGLVLSHWGKARVEQPDYVFARFNVKSETTSYTEAEYEAALANHHDPMMKWTKEETDVLLRLCQRFDLR